MKSWLEGERIEGENGQDDICRSQSPDAPAVVSLVDEKISRPCSR